MPLFTRIFFTLVIFRSSWTPAEANEAPPNNSDPCANNPCGPPEFGTCVVAGRGYRCECREGYKLSHFNYCVPEGPCGTFPCGKHSETCLWVGENQYRCICKRGFAEHSLVSPTCVAAEGECGTQPCGLGGLCTPTPDGKHDCQCVPGFRPVPSTQGITCRREPRIGCESQPCGDAAVAKCVDTPTGYYCICREGSLPYFNVEGGASCLPEKGYEPCYTGACGERGVDCVFDGDRRSCSCEDGYEGKSVNLWDDERCYAETYESDSESETPGTDEGDGEAPGAGDTKPNQKVSNTVLVAGGVVGALLLLAAIGGAIAYRRRKSPKDQGLVEHQRSVDFEGRDGSGTQDGDADILIKARNEDWAQ